MIDAVSRRMWGAAATPAPASLRPDLSDKGIVELAARTPGAENALSLHCQFRMCCKRREIFSGSVTYLGEHVALTDAHCVSLWCDKDGRLKDGYSLIVRSGTEAYRVTDVIIHPAYIYERLLHDIAMLRLEKVIEGLEGLKPDYSEGKIVQWTTCVGFGSSGGSKAWLSRIDGRKRAVSVLLNDKYELKGGVNLVSYHGGCYGVDSNGRRVFIRRSLLDHECGTRPGMSGSPLLNSTGRVIALMKGGQPGDSRWISWLRGHVKYRFSKYIAALGIPAPCMIPYEGEVSSFTPLGPYRDWIERHRMLCNKKKK